MPMQVSFSPLEMAKAFESPLFAEFNSNSSGRDIAKDAEESDIKYGVLTADADGTDGRRRIAFGESGSVMKPQKGTNFTV